MSETLNDHRIMMQRHIVVMATPLTPKACQVCGEMLANDGIAINMFALTVLLHRSCAAAIHGKIGMFFSENPPTKEQIPLRLCPSCDRSVDGSDPHVCLPQDESYTQVNNVARRMLSEGRSPRRIRFAEPFYEMIRRSDAYRRYEDGRQVLETAAGPLEIDPLFFAMMRFEIQE